MDELRHPLARLIVEARRTGEAAVLPDGAPRPADFAAAYGIQDEVIAALGPAAGWKVGAASRGGAPYCAPVFVQDLREGPGVWRPRSFNYRCVEAEIAYRLGRDLPARGQAYTEDETWAAIASVHPAIEVVASRFTDFDTLSVEVMAADNLNNAGLIVGSAAQVPPRLVNFDDQKASLLVDGVEAVRAVGGNPCGAPGQLLAWLANHCAGRGRALRAGDMVTTGTHTGMFAAPLGSHVVARFAGLGEVSLRLKAE